MLRRRVYLDNNATTPLHPLVRKELIDCLDLFGNPASIHAPGREAEEKVEAARESIARLLGAATEEIIFTGGGSESNATVFATFAGTAGQVLISSIEHPSVRGSADALREGGVKVRALRVDGSGRLDLDDLEDALRTPTALVSVMAANNEIGTLQEIDAVTRAAHAGGALVHTDAVQAAGKVPLDVRGLGVDYLSASAHKIYGPKGVGALFVRAGARLRPLIRGGHQESDRRAGTVNAPGIAGFGKAADCAREELADLSSRVTALRETLRAGIREIAPRTVFNGHPTLSLPGTLHATFPGVEGESLVLRLDLEGICVSTGSACSSRSDETSATLKAIGASRAAARSSVRFSLGRESTREDVDLALEKLPAALARAQSSAKGGRG